MYSRFVLPLFALALVSACASSSAPADTTATATSTTPPATATVDAPAAAAPAPDPNVCPLKPGAWEACVGKLVEIRGKNPPIVYQHPVLAPMAAPGSDKPTIQQSYLETDEGGQVIVLSKQQDTCTGAKRVKGTLRAIDLGGPSGTKLSYKGWSVDDAAIVCE